MNEERKEIDAIEKPDLTGLYAGNTILFIGMILVLAGCFSGYRNQTVSPFVYGWLLVGIGTLIRQVRAIYLNLFE